MYFEPLQRNGVTSRIIVIVHPTLTLRTTYSRTHEQRIYPTESGGDHLHHFDDGLEHDIVPLDHG